MVEYDLAKVVTRVRFSATAFNHNNSYKLKQIIIKMVTEQGPIFLDTRPGYLTFDAQVGQTYGFCARPSALIAKFVMNNFYQDQDTKDNARVLFEKDNKEVPGRSIMGLMTLEAYKGSTVRVSIRDGQTPEEKEKIRGLAKKLYAGITTTADYDVDFDRLD